MSRGITSANAQEARNENRELSRRVDALEKAFSILVDKIKSSDNATKNPKPKVETHFGISDKDKAFFQRKLKQLKEQYPLRTIIPNDEFEDVMIDMGDGRVITYDEWYIENQKTEERES